MSPFIFLYITLFLLFVIETHITNNRKKKKIGILGLIIIFLFIGLRSKDVGTDTKTYLYFFHDANFLYNAL